MRVQLKGLSGVAFLMCLLALLVLIFYVHTVTHRAVHVADGFESMTLSPIWMRARMVPGAFTTQSRIVQNGSRAGQITLHSNDRFEAGDDDGAASERDELMENWRFWSRAGLTYSQSFSLYLPVDFPIVNDRLVIAQWKQLCEWKSCRPDNPVLAIRFVNGVLFITRKDDAGEEMIYKTRNEIRGRWLNFRFVTRFSPHTDGLIDGWLDGQQIVHYRGVTAYSRERGYPQAGVFFFKMGLYRNLMAFPMTIYVDSYRKDQCSAKC